MQRAFVVNAATFGGVELAAGIPAFCVINLDQGARSQLQ